MYCRSVYFMSLYYSLIYWFWVKFPFFSKFTKFTAIISKKLPFTDFAKKKNYPDFRVFEKTLQCRTKISDLV